MTKKQFFIYGNPRSGSSLLRLLLNSHSKVTVPPECGFYHWLAAKYGSWNANNLNKSDIDNYLEDLQNSKKFETWLLPSSLIKRVIEENKPQNYNELSTCVYLSYARLHNKVPTVLGDKNNYYIKHLEELFDLAPEKYIIHIVRDGRDTACSYREIKGIDSSHKYKPILPTEITEIAKEWSTNNLNVYNFYKYRKNFLLVKYEDILQTPIQVLTQILNFLELEFEKGMLNFYKENQQKQIEPKETVAWKQKTLQPIDSKDIGVFREKLSNQEIIEFNETAKDALNLFNYDVEC